MADYPLLMIRAEIESGKATVRSLGALYMVAMASRAQAAAKNDDPSVFTKFTDINTEIGRHLVPDGTFAEQMRKLDKVKQIGWQLYEKVCLLQKIEAAR